MAVLQTILDVLSQRIASLIGGAVASRVETMVVLEQVDQHEMLEKRALELEKEGKPHLAESLRKRARGVDPANPGSQGQVILAQLAASTPSAPTTSLLENGLAEEESRPRRRRRTSKRVGTVQPETTSEEHNE
jgi:hypothetical protein